MPVDNGADHSFSHFTNAAGDEDSVGPTMVYRNSLNYVKKPNRTKGLQKYLGGHFKAKEESSNSGMGNSFIKCYDFNSGQIFNAQACIADKYRDGEKEGIMGMQYDIANESNEGNNCPFCDRMAESATLTISPKLQLLAVVSSSEPSEEDIPGGDLEDGKVRYFINESKPEMLYCMEYLVTVLYAI